jgi:hypothetical protein
MAEQINACSELDTEDQQKKDGQGDVPPTPVPHRRASKNGAHARSAEHDADDTDNHCRIPHVGSRHQAEQRDGERIGKRQQRGGGADLLANIWQGLRGAALPNGPSDEQEARERTG